MSIEAIIEAACTKVESSYGVTVTYRARRLMFATLEAIASDPSPGWQMYPGDILALQERAGKRVEPVLTQLARKIRDEGQSYITYFDVLHAMHRVMENPALSVVRIPRYPVDVDP